LRSLEDKEIYLDVKEMDRGTAWHVTSRSMLCAYVQEVTQAHYAGLGK